jgi:hypothetical protein
MKFHRIGADPKQLRMLHAFNFVSLALFVKSVPETFLLTDFAFST